MFYHRVNDSLFYVGFGTICRFRPAGVRRRKAPNKVLAVATTLVKTKPERARNRQDPDKEAAKTGSHAGVMHKFITFQCNLSLLCHSCIPTGDGCGLDPQIRAGC